MTAASASIHPRLPIPTTNMTSISAQQQPTQNDAVVEADAKRVARRMLSVPARADERERCPALVEAAVLERAPLEQAGAGEHRDAHHPAMDDEPRVSCRRPPQRLVGRVRNHAEREPRDEESRDDERREPARVRSRAGDPPEHREQRERRRQHHRGDHQHPRARVQRQARSRRPREWPGTVPPARHPHPSRRARDSARTGLALHSHSAIHDVPTSSASRLAQQRMAPARGGDRCGRGRCHAGRSDPPATSRCGGRGGLRRIG